MVDGVHGNLDHVVKHVVVEYRIILEYVIILNLYVEGKTVKVQEVMQLKRSAIISAVQVSFIIVKNKLYNYMHKDQSHFTLH